MRIYIYPSILIFLFVIVTGCASSFQQNWHDFTAYYNTFYNATQYYDEGLSQNLQQQPEMNPEEPVRIHLSPSNAGADEFANAIEKCADILRRHNQSGYVDQAIEMIGKSYYYRQEYFSALEKFQELFNTTSDEIMKQYALIWEGRTYLEMEIYGEGTQILETRLASSLEWSPELRSEARIILAQHYVKQEEWEKASEVLESALDGLEDLGKKARGYFLYGQILEKTGDLGPSYVAFREVRNHRPSYELEYYARYKEADIYRQMGFYHNAYDHFRSMERNDKHFERRPELLYEMAKTEQMRGNPGEARRLYNRVLRYRATNPAPLVLAKSYYGMAELYREFFADFEMAAAYYDSAAMQRVDERFLPEDWNIQEQASAFGEYAEVTRQISRIDSLLDLASLEPAELDSVLARIQAQHQQDQVRRDEIQLGLMQSEEGLEELTTETTEAVNGFLNIRNRAMLERLSLQFQARWGNRPLADNWRRMEAVSGSGRNFEEQQVVVQKEGIPEPATPDLSASSSEPGIHLGDIPMTEAEQDSMISEKIKKYYQLGSVFLLNLNLPDSAGVYFKRVLSEEQINVPNLKPRALYALSEISRMENDQEEADKWLEILLESYPDSPISTQIMNRTASSVPHSEAKRDGNGTRPDLSELYRDVSTVPFNRAHNLYRLALDLADPGSSPVLLYEAAREYILAGREDNGTENGRELKFKSWQQVRENWEEVKTTFFAMQDTANKKLMDSTLAEGERIYWKGIADSTLPEPDFTRVFPYKGTEWDSARSVLQKLDSYYPNSQANQKAEYLRQELRLPEEDARAGPGDPGFSAGTWLLPSTMERNEIRCEEPVGSVTLRGGMTAFLERVNFPSWTEDLPFPDGIEYLFIINPEGYVLDYAIRDSADGRFRGSGIPEALEEAFDNDFHFDAPEKLGAAGKIQCHVRFGF
ncbi:MAG: hypothetical protein WD035_05795 [Balneolaceae bacterium]